MGKHSAEDAGLVYAVRSSVAAWDDLRRAEEALTRHMASSLDGKRYGAVLERITLARTSLEAAYEAMVPRKRRRSPARRAYAHAVNRGRSEELHRCLYCHAMVWASDRRPHLKFVEGINDERWAQDDQLTAHFELAVRSAAQDQDEDLDEDDK